MDVVGLMPSNCDRYNFSDFRLTHVKSHRNLISQKTESVTFAALKMPIHTSKAMFNCCCCCCSCCCQWWTVYAHVYDINLLATIHNICSYNITATWTNVIAWNSCYNVLCIEMMKNWKFIRTRTHTHRILMFTTFIVSSFGFCCFFHLAWAFHSFWLDSLINFH